MNPLKTSFTVAAIVLVAACHTSKKATTSTAAATPAPAPTNTVAAAPVVISRSPDGIYVPGNEELSAIQDQYKDLTLDKLKQGHQIYSVGACVNCHRAKSIYYYNETEWKGIMDDMAKKARLSDEQKDAVYKYVLAVKAVKAKQGQ